MDRRPILLVATHFQKGGAERQMGLLAKHLAAPDFPVIHLALAGSPTNPDEGSPHCQRHNLNLKSFRSLGTLATFWRYCRKVSPAAILSCVTVCDALAASWAVPHRIPWILREPSSYDGRPRDWNVRLRSQLGRWATSVIANNRGGYRYWIQRKQPHAVHMIPNIIDSEEILSKAGQPGVAPKLPPRYFLLAGRLESLKNFGFAIRALASIKDLVPDVHLIILGEGAKKQALVDAITESKLTARVHLLGNVANPYPYFCHADAIISCSKYEGLSNVAMEAIILKRPLLLSDIPAHRDEFSCDIAKFFPLDDPAPLASLILQHERHPWQMDHAFTAARENLLRDWLPQNVARAYRQAIETVIAKN